LSQKTTYRFGMEWLNYHHLLYFWVVAKEGSIVRASKELRLAHPTISGQIHRLEEILGEKLFSRKGRNLVLTDVGRVAFRYADEIFSLGREFLDTVKGREVGRPIRLVVGIAHVLSTSIVKLMLEPAFLLKEQVRVSCREARSTEAFLGELAVQAVDVVPSDAPAAPGTAVRAFNHLLGECGTAFFAAPRWSLSVRRHGSTFLLELGRPQRPILRDPHGLGCPSPQRPIQASALKDPIQFGGKKKGGDSRRPQQTDQPRRYARATIC